MTRLPGLAAYELRLRAVMIMPLSFQVNGHLTALISDVSNEDFSLRRRNENSRKSGLLVCLECEIAVAAYLPLMKIPTWPLTTLGLERSCAVDVRPARPLRNSQKLLASEKLHSVCLKERWIRNPT